MNEASSGEAVRDRKRVRYRRMRIVAGYICVIVHIVLMDRLGLYSTLERHVYLVLKLFSLSVFQVIVILPVVVRDGWRWRLATLPVMVLGGIGLCESLLQSFHIIETYG